MKWHYLWRRSQEDQELEEELKFHIAEETRLRSDRGERPDSASQSARRDFGNMILTREVTRDMWGWTALEHARQDLQFALRMLRKSPTFTAIAIGALALGVGATTAIFSVVNAVLLKPLSFPEPSRLVMVWEHVPNGKATNVVQTQNFLDWRSRNRFFENIAAIHNIPLNFEGPGDPIQVPSLRVTAGFFEILGVLPLLGRAISSADDQPGAPPVVILSHGIWERNYGSRPDVLGQKILIGGKSAEIIGVMPPRFQFPTVRADLYVPMGIRPADAPIEGRNYMTVARLKPGASVESAQADMSAIAAQLARERPRMNTGFGATVVPLLDQTVGDMRPALLVMQGAVAFVLLIACANVANLLLMRATSRRREMAVRVALGAGRGRLILQLMVESLILALIGGLLGFLLAWLGVPAIVRMLPANFPLPRMSEITVDGGVLGFSLFLSLGCGILFGLFPALQLNRNRVNDGLRSGGRHGSSANGGVRAVLVVAEVSLAVLLVIGAGLMIRSFMLLNKVDVGFRPERLLTFRMLLTPAQAPTFEQYQAQRAALMTQMLDRVRGLPGISAASSMHLPPFGGNSGSEYNRADRPAPPPGTPSGGDVSIVSDNFFHTMEIPILAGRDFDPRDVMGRPKVAVLNASAANMLYPGENPLGKSLRVSWGFGPNFVEIVGVAADIHHEGAAFKPEPCLFMPNAQQPSGYATLLVRTSGDPLAMVTAVREQLRQAAPHQGTLEIQTMERLMSDSVARPRLESTILGVFGTVALILACVGIYAVISYSVEQRTREMGIRLALGARGYTILRLVLVEGMSLAGAGIVIGILAALALTRYLAALLYTIRPTDTLVYSGVSALLILAAAAGCYFPARRATRVDPGMVLREE